MINLMLIVVSIALILLAFSNMFQTSKLNRVTDELQASDSVIAEAYRAIESQRVTDETLANPILTGVLIKLDAQTAKGLKKYGNTVDPDEYTEDEWLLHFQQEMIDGAVYAETLLQKRGEGNAKD